MSPNVSAQVSLKPSAEGFVSSCSGNVFSLLPVCISEGLSLAEQLLTQWAEASLVSTFPQMLQEERLQTPHLNANGPSGDHQGLCPQATHAYGPDHTHGRHSLNEWMNESYRTVEGYAFQPIGCNLIVGLRNQCNGHNIFQVIEWKIIG